MHPMLRLGGLAAILLVAVACGGGSAAVAPDELAGTGGAAGGTARAPIARPALLADLPLVELAAPPVSNAGPAPTFEWGAVDGAATYRLSVLGPDGPRWGWEGSETSIRYGAVEDGQRGPVIVPGSWWSVAAIAEDGGIVAASELRPVSPADDPGPDPVWLDGDAADAPGLDTGGAASAEPPSPAGPITAENVKPCTLLSTEQLESIIGPGWTEPVEELYPHGKGGTCEWTYSESQFGGGVVVSVSRRDAYNPDGWGGESDPLLDGIGEEAYLTRSGMDRKVGFVRGEVSVLLTFDYGEIDFAKYAAVARLVDAAME